MNFWPDRVHRLRSVSGKEYNWNLNMIMISPYISLYGLHPCIVIESMHEEPSLSKMPLLQYNFGDEKFLVILQDGKFHTVVRKTIFLHCIVQLLWKQMTCYECWRCFSSSEEFIVSVECNGTGF